MMMHVIYTYLPTYLTYLPGRVLKSWVKRTYLSTFPTYLGPTYLPNLTYLPPRKGIKKLGKEVMESIKPYLVSVR